MTTIPLVWGPHQRDGQERQEWHAPCGCAFQFRAPPEILVMHPVWHPCERHAPKVEAELAQADRPIVTAPKGLIWGWNNDNVAHLFRDDMARRPRYKCGGNSFSHLARVIGGYGVQPCAKCAARMEAKS